ncbi:MAG: diacylglycerol kinase family protein, partial [Kineosporiaceae bacterium]
PGELPRVAVIANPTKVDDGEGRRAWLKRASAEAGFGPPLWLETTVDDPGTGQAREAGRSGAAAVFVYGGDGTVRAVATGLSGTDVPIALIPAGTGNLLARNLNIPVIFPDAAATIGFTGRVRHIDVGRAEVDVSGADVAPRRETFLVMAGLGFDAEVMASVEPKLKRTFGWWAYVVAGARLVRGRQTKVALYLDGRPPMHRRIRSVVVGNCGELTGGIRLLPDAQVDDGWLDVVAVSPRNVVGWAAVTASVLSGSRRGHPLVERYRCRRVEIRAEKPLHMQLDGDPAGRARVLRVDIDRLALSVKVRD